jgi:uncharacterized membrane protein
LLLHLGKVAEKDVILAALGSDIAVAGLVLVFAGFLMTKADSFEGSRSGDKFNWLALGGLIPIVASLVAAWMCVDALQGSEWEASHTLLMLKIVLALTGGYAIISAVLAFFP